MDGITPHDHGRVLGICQKGHRARIRDGVNPAQLDVNLEANICKVLRFSVPTLMTLQTLSCYSDLMDIVGQEKWT